MKSLLFSLSFILISLAVNAQETKSTINSKQTEKNNAEQTENSLLNALVENEKENITIDKVCYGEISKVAYYEALISENGFKINLKNSTDLAIKSTEEIITKKIDQVLYSEDD